MLCLTVAFANIRREVREKPDLTQFVIPVAVLLVCAAAWVVLSKTSIDTRHGTEDLCGAKIARLRASITEYMTANDTLPQRLGQLGLSANDIFCLSHRRSLHHPNRRA